MESGTDINFAVRRQHHSCGGKYSTGFYSSPLFSLSVLISSQWYFTYYFSELSINIHFSSTSPVLRQYSLLQYSLHSTRFSSTPYQVVSPTLKSLSAHPTNNLTSLCSHLYYTPSEYSHSHWQLKTLTLHHLSVVDVEEIRVHHRLENSRQNRNAVKTALEEVSVNPVGNIQRPVDS